MLRQDCAPSTRTLAPALPSTAIPVTPTSRSRLPRRAAQALVALLAVAAWLGPAAVARAGAELVPGGPEQAVADEGVSRVDPEATTVYTYDDELAKVGGVQPATEIAPVPEETATNNPVAPEGPVGPQVVTIDVKPVPDSPKDTAPPAPPNALDAARAAAVAEVKASPHPARPETPAVTRTARQVSKRHVAGSQPSFLESARPTPATPADSRRAANAELERTAPPPTAVSEVSNPAPALPSLPERSPDSPGAPLGTGAAFGAIGGGVGGGLVVAILLALFLFTAPAGLRKVRLPDVVLVAPLLARASARPG